MANVNEDSSLNNIPLEAHIEQVEENNHDSNIASDEHEDGISVTNDGMQDDDTEIEMGGDDIDSNVGLGEDEDGISITNDGMQDDDIDIEMVGDDHDSRVASDEHEHGLSITIDGLQDMGNVDFKNLNVSVIKNCTFLNLEVAFMFYNMYAKVMGFSGRKHKLLRSTKGEILQQTFVCHKQGRRADIFGDGRTRKREPMKDIRCGCKAQWRVHIDRNSERWCVKYFGDVHNHLLVPANRASLLPGHRKMNIADISQTNHMRTVGIKPHDAFGSLASQMGGFENLTFSKRNMYYELDKQRKKELPDGRGTLAYLRSLKSTDENMYWKYLTNDNKSIKQLFWTDGHGQRDYALFGDVLAFDATYNKNRYKCPLVVFSGVNHHNKTIVFGAAIVSNELVETYVWVLEHLLDAMKGKMPKSVITDGDKAMKKTIAKVFPNAKHRLCAWHLLENANRNVKKPIFTELFKTCMFGDFDVAYFERRWEDMVVECEVQDNIWVKELYEKRTMWAAAHMRGNFFAGFRTTSRAEGLNAQLCRYVNIHNNLKDFVQNFQRCCSSLRFTEIEDDLVSMEGEQVLLTPLVGLERSASIIYTRKIFIMFRSVLQKASTFRVLRKKETATRHIYFVGKYNNNHREWNVLYCPSTIEFKCSCLRMESVGIPCDHIVCVMLRLDMVEMPKSLILERWTKLAKEAVNEQVQFKSSGWDPMQTCRFAALLECCRNMCKLASKLPEDFDQAKLVVLGQIKKLEAKQVQVVNDGDAISGEEDGERYVRNPNIVRTKGRGKGSSQRNVSGTRKLHCGICGGVGHNRKTCSNRGQENTVEVGHDGAGPSEVHAEEEVYDMNESSG